MFEDISNNFFKDISKIAASCEQCIASRMQWSVIAWQVRSIALLKSAKYTTELIALAAVHI